MLQLVHIKVIQKEVKIIDDATAKESRKISNLIIEKFLKGDFSEVIIVSNKFKNAGTQIMSVEKILPISIQEKDVNKREKSH